jgi:hypothetical protein
LCDAGDGAPARTCEAAYTGPWANPLNFIPLENRRMTNGTLPRPSESKGAGRRSTFFLRLISAASRAEIIIDGVLSTGRREITVIAFVLDAFEASE